jgi:hypothetical protein
MKKSLLFGLLAVFAAVFIFTACDNGTTSSSEPTPSGDREEILLEVDIPVGTEADLRTELSTAANKGKIIGLLTAASIPVTTTPLEIPEGYKVYVLGSGGLATAAGLGITVKGELLVGANSTLEVPVSGAPISVTDDGIIKVVTGGTLKIQKLLDIDDGAQPPAKKATVVGETSKVTVTHDGILSLDSYKNLSELRTAFASIEEGTLVVVGSKPVKPSDILKEFPTTTDKKLTIRVSGVEDATSLTIPEGLDLTSIGSLSSVTSLVIDGTFTASGNLSNVTSLVVNSEFTTSANLSGVTDLKVKGEGSFTTTGSARLGTLTVEVDEDASLTLGHTTVTTTLQTSTIDGSLAISAGSITLATDAVLTIIDPTYVTGAGVIIAETTGTITVGSAEGAVAGYTTTAGGIAGGALGTALEALDDDYYGVITNATSLAEATFGPDPANAIGTVTITDDDPTAVQRPVNAVATAIQLDAATTFEGTATVAQTGTDATISGTITFDWTGGALTIDDDGYVVTTPKNIVLTFTGYRLANNGLVSPVTWSVPFSIGVSTGRS